jgi:hypothetical protein
MQGADAVNAQVGRRGGRRYPPRVFYVYAGPKPHCNGNGAPGGGAVTVSVTSVFTGRVSHTAMPGSRITGRDYDGDGRPDILNRANSNGTITYTPSGSRIRRTIECERPDSVRVFHG